MNIYKSPDELIEGVEAYLLNLRQNHGRMEVPVVIDWSGAQSDETRKVRLSGGGKCPRQSAYAIHYPEDGEELSARALSVFMHGDLLHDQERYLIGNITYLMDVEKLVQFPLGDGREVAGHIDGKIILDGKTTILDIKSINTRGFKEVLNGTPREDYIFQVQGYMDAEDVDQAVIWFYNKDTSHRTATLVERDPEYAATLRERFASILDSTPDNLPDRMYDWAWEISRGKRTGRQYLVWQCGYCPFVARCWDDEGFELVFDKGKPRWMRDSEEVEEG